MTLVKFNNRPAGKSIDNLFSDFFNNFPANWGQSLNEEFFSPAVNVHETKEAYHIELNAPGRAKEDFVINVENGMLSIGYEHKSESKQEDYKTIRREFAFRSFKRSFQVDDSVNVDQIQARYENGILKLLLPKKEEVKSGNRQITIQ